MYPKFLYDCSSSLKWNQALVLSMDHFGPCVVWARFLNGPQTLTLRRYTEEKIKKKAKESENLEESSTAEAKFQRNRLLGV